MEFIQLQNKEFLSYIFENLLRHIQNPFYSEDTFLPDLKNHIEVNKLTLSNNAFWYVIENFENNYPIFIKQLQMLSLFNKRIDLISDIEKITFVDNKIEINKIFFNIFKENKVLTRAFNKSINSLSDFYIFLNSTKSYLEIIKNSNDTESALYNFPKYLFAEKDVFLKIYNKTKATS